MTAFDPHKTTPAEIADFVAELERYSVPFGVEIGGKYVLTPAEAWHRVHRTYPPTRTGGIPPAISARMRSATRRSAATAEVSDDRMGALPPGQPAVCVGAGRPQPAPTTPPTRGGAPAAQPSARSPQEYGATGPSPAPAPALDPRCHP